MGEVSVIHAAPPLLVFRMTLLPPPPMQSDGVGQVTDWMGCGVGSWDQLLPASVVANGPMAGPPTTPWDGFGQVMSPRESPCGTGFCQYQAGGPDAARADLGGVTAAPGMAAGRFNSTRLTAIRRTPSRAVFSAPPPPLSLPNLAHLFES